MPRNHEINWSLDMPFSGATNLNKKERDKDLLLIGVPLKSSHYSSQIKYSEFPQRFTVHPLRTFPTVFECRMAMQ